MNIENIFKKELVIADLKAPDKITVLEEMVEKIHQLYPRLQAKDLLNVLIERERLGSTGIGDGFAIPHGKIQGLEDLLLGFGRALKGLDFSAMDGKPTQFFFLLMAPEGQAGIHLKALARLSRLIKTPHFHEELLKAQTGEELYQVILRKDQDL
jgi:PTS system nitrogen regulatory IIA component